MNFSENHNIPGLLVSIDFEKAFDSIAWSFINKTLEIFNFGHDIKKWIHILNSDITATVIQMVTYQSILISTEDAVIRFHHIFSYYVLRY